MTERTAPTQPQFRPVPAVPIIVLPAPKGVRVVRIAARLAAGPTLRDAIEAAMKARPSATTSPPGD